MVKESITIQDALDLLNEIVEKDKACAKALLNARVPCNQAIAEHPTIQVHAYDGNPPTVGLIGFLNGLFGIDDETGMGALAASVYPDNGDVCEFVRTPKQDSKIEKH